ncbi:MAG: glycosyltransferase family protein [Bacteriovoracaceae bacterium]
MKNIGIITQARMSSTRLPGKILKTLKNRSLLQHHIDRLKNTQLPICVAFTINAQDDVIEPIVKNQNLLFHRGSEEDVLSRYLECAHKYNFDHIVRVTSDCPLIDSSLILQGLDYFKKNSNPYLYVSNCIERTYPRGFDFEIFSTEYLEEANLKARATELREHVTPYIWKNIGGKTQFFHIKNEIDKSSYRLCVDEPADFRLMEILIEQNNMDQKSYLEIIKFLDQNREIANINLSVEQKKV